MLVLVTSAMASLLAFGTQARPAFALELVMFEEIGCHWCEQWDQDIGVIYNKTTEGKRAPLRRVDIHGTWPGDVKHLYPVSFTPTFVLIEGKTEVGRILGYPGEDFFWPLLGELLKKVEDKVRPKPATQPSTTRIDFEVAPSIAGRSRTDR